MRLMNESPKNNIWRMFEPIKIIILILSIQLIPVHSDEQTNKDITKLINYAKILLSGLTDHITYVGGKFADLNQLTEREVSDLIKNYELHQAELKPFENRLHFLQTNLTALASWPLVKEADISAAKKKSVKLRNKLYDLFNELNKLRICRNIPLFYDHKKIDEVMEKYNNLVAQKMEIYKKIEDKEQTQLVDDCVLAIESRRYHAAAEKFNLVRDDNKIEDIVKRLYSEDGAYFLLDFGSTIKNLKRTYLLYKAMFNELRNDKERSKSVFRHFYKYSPLYRSLKREVLNQPVIDSYLKAKAEDLLKAVREEEVKLGSKLLTDVLHINDSRAEQILFLKSPLTYDYEVVGEICYQTIVDNHKQHLNDLKDTLNLVFTELSKTYEGNALHFGQFIKYFETKLKGSEYESLLQLDLVGVKEKLPEIVRNILYSENVCIKQDGSDRYLIQAGDNYTYLMDSYRVHTGQHRSELEERWQLVHVQSDEYIIKNLLHNYSLDIDVTKLHILRENTNDHTNEHTNDHKVITTNKKTPGQSNIWKIEVASDYAYLKNTANNEYLYAWLEFTKGDAATSNFMGELSKAYHWNILDCTNAPLREGPPQ